MPRSQLPVLSLGWLWLKRSLDAYLQYYELFELFLLVSKTDEFYEIKCPYQRLAEFELNMKKMIFLYSLSYG